MISSAATLSPALTLIAFTVLLASARPLIIGVLSLVDAPFASAGEPTLLETYSARIGVGATVSTVKLNGVDGVLMLPVASVAVMVRL